MFDLRLMNSNRYNPWRGFFDVDGWVPTEAMQTRFLPEANVEETDTHYLLSFDLPGVSKKDIHIEIKDQRLTVAGERRSQQKAGSERYGKFERVFELPVHIDADKTEAHYEDGVLHVAIAKSEAAKPREIKIAEGKSGFLDKFFPRSEKEAGTKAA